MYLTRTSDVVDRLVEERVLRLHSARSCLVDTVVVDELDHLGDDARVRHLEQSLLDRSRRLCGACALLRTVEVVALLDDRIGCVELHKAKLRDLLSGLPKTVTISTAQASAAIETSVMRIVDCVKKVLEDTPPELAADIMDRGIVLTGGGALLYGMAELIQRETGTPTLVADDPMSCVALGCGKALDIFDKFDGKATNTSFGRKK